MLARRIVLVDQSSQVDPKELAHVAAVLSVQVSRDLARFWPVEASVEVLAAGAAVPVGAWPVWLVSNLPRDEGGFHLDKTNQPYAKVEVGDGWSVAASHELLEMLVDPSGNFTHAARGIAVVDGAVQDTDGVLDYLLEVSDPSEDPACGYLIDGVRVSDFITPRFFDDAYETGAQYSFTGAIQAPRRVLKWGYLSWHCATADLWFQLNFVDHDPPQITPMRQVVDATSMREVSDRSIKMPGHRRAQAHRHGAGRSEAARG